MKPPTLGPGEATPEVFQRWESGCLAYFQAKQVPEDQQVARVAPGLQDALVSAWYLHERTELNNLAFSLFMARLRDEFLDPDWVPKLRRDIGRMAQGDKPFSEYANAVLQRNALLLGTEEHMSELLLKYHLESHLHDKTAKAVDKARLAPDLGLTKWRLAVKEIDDYRREKEINLQKLVHQEIAKREREKNATARAGLTNRPSRTANTSTPFTKLPTLLPTEKELLDKHAGCYKCRRFYVFHQSKQCQNPYPDANTYNTLTPKDA
ncbi:hypothetical protein SCHPADRAFT_820302, partial [Schizopora paradoxa]